jgi:hypothetical protein
MLLLFVFLRPYASCHNCRDRKTHCRTGDCLNPGQADRLAVCGNGESAHRSTQLSQNIPVDLKDTFFKPILYPEYPANYCPADISNPVGAHGDGKFRIVEHAHN